MSKLLLFLAIFILLVSANVDLTGFNVFSLNAGTPETTINVAKGELFALKIPSNPTTGFNWYVMNSAELKSSNILVALNLNGTTSGEYQKDDSPFGMVGVGGNAYFKFQGVNSGSSTIRLDYMRIWEHAPINSLMVKVEVA